MLDLTNENYKGCLVSLTNRHTQDATIPFKLTFSMPALDKRTRGYTPKYIKELQTTVGGGW
jgi:hypothetical protein